MKELYVMNQILTSLGIIASFHDNDRSVLDAFVPAVEFCIASLNAEHDANHYNIADLQDKLFRSTGLSISQFSLKNLLKRFHRQKTIYLMSDDSFRILETFKEIQPEYLESVQFFTRNIKKFIKNYREFSHDERSEEEITDWIYKFIADHKNSVEINRGNISADNGIDNYSLFVEFLRHINEYDNDLVEIFTGIYRGYTLCELFNTSKFDSDISLAKELTVYLDSNFILRLLDLQAERFTKQTKELYGLLKKNNIKLKVFEETLKEVKDVISYYRQTYQHNKNLCDIFYGNDNIDGVLGAFCRRKLTNTNIDQILETIDSTISEYGISCDSINRYKVSYDERNVELLYKRKYGPSLDETNKECRYRINKCKTYLEIIETIKYLRTRTGATASCLGDSKYVFLTCDWKLFKFIKDEFDGSFGFFPIITQELLSDDMLVLNPQDFSKLSFDLLISAYTNSKYLDIAILSDIKQKIHEIAKTNPTEADLIIRATKNVEYFDEISQLYDDNDQVSERQLIDFVNERKDILQKDEIAHADQLAKYQIKLDEAEEQNNTLTRENSEISQKYANLLTNNNEYIKNELKKYKKKIKIITISVTVIVSICEILGAVWSFLSSLNNTNKVGLIIGGIILTLTTLATCLVSALKFQTNEHYEKLVNKKEQQLNDKLLVKE